MHRIDPTQRQRNPEPIHSRPRGTRTYIYTGIFNTGTHFHEEHQLLYAEGGVLTVLTDESQFLLPAYHGAWIPARCVHKLVSSSEETKIWLLYFFPDAEEGVALQSVRIFGVSTLAREMFLYTERWSQMEKYHEESSPLEQHFYETVRLLAAEWCKVPLSLVLPHTEDDLLSQITHHVLENIGEPLDVATIAHLHGLSGRTLMRLFRSGLGITFGTYLRIARIIKAVELLTSSSVSVLDVAYTVGYRSPSSFSQAFRQLTGMTPQEYARRR